MLGSVFSPYYAWSGRENPLDHIGLNVGLYGKGVKRWTLTERGENDLDRSRHHLAIGPSSLLWDGNCLTVQIDETACPLPRRVRGTIRLYPDSLVEKAFGLDDHGKHFWQPLSPRARVEVEFAKPSLSWKGTAYIDSNWGAEPLEKGFKSWDWSRAHSRRGTHVLYDAFTRDGCNTQLALEIDKSGVVSIGPPPPRHVLQPAPVWKVARSTLAKQWHSPSTGKMLEDTPFYTRSWIRTNMNGEAVTAIHESLDCDRFAANWVRMLLPFRMPRIASTPR